MSRFTDILNTELENYKTANARLYDIVEPVAHGCKGDDINGLVDMYLLLDSIKDMCDAMSKACNIHMPEIAENAAKKMQQSDTDSITRRGYVITPDTKTYVSVNKDNKPLVLLWLKNHTAGKELVAEDYNANAFSAFIKGLLEVGGYSKESKDPAKMLPAEISTFDKPVLSVKKKRS